MEELKDSKVFDDVVSYETAKLAKELGYEGYVGLGIGKKGWYYNHEGILNGDCTEDLKLIVNAVVAGLPRPASRLISAPTQSVLQRWLRENHNIDVSVEYKPNIKKWDFFPNDMNMNGVAYCKCRHTYYRANPERRFDTYELALEAGLCEALKNIK